MSFLALHFPGMASRGGANGILSRIAVGPEKTNIAVGSEDRLED
jgi:hypothetical protein